jgi:putative hemolysin
MRTIGLIVMALCIVACSGAAHEKSPEKKPAKKKGIANPASVKCVEDGHKLEIRTGEGGGQVGICINAEGKECEEWKYFRGECEL